MKKAPLQLCVLFLMLFGFAAKVFAFDVDTKKYFAYYKVPDRRAANYYNPGPYILLSHEKCQAKGVHKDVNAKKALSVNETYNKHECWLEQSKEIILVCPTKPFGQKEDAEIDDSSAACMEISKSRFKDTESLPKSAKF